MIAKLKAIMRNLKNSVTGKKPKKSPPLNNRIPTINQTLEQMVLTGENGATAQLEPLNLDAIQQRANDADLTTQAGRIAIIDNMYAQGQISAAMYLELIEALDDMTPEEIAEVDAMIRDGR